jgi:hypothetical protein
VNEEYGRRSGRGRTLNETFSEIFFDIGREGFLFVLGEAVHGTEGWILPLFEVDGAVVGTVGRELINGGRREDGVGPRHVFFGDGGVDWGWRKGIFTNIIFEGWCSRGGSDVGGGTGGMETEEGYLVVFGVFSETRGVAEGDFGFGT